MDGFNKQWRGARRRKGLSITMTDNTKMTADEIEYAVNMKGVDDLKALLKTSLSQDARDAFTAEINDRENNSMSPEEILSSWSAGK